MSLFIPILNLYTAFKQYTRAPISAFEKVSPHGKSQHSKETWRFFRTFLTKRGSCGNKRVLWSLDMEYFIVLRAYVTLTFD